MTGRGLFFRFYIALSMLSLALDVRLFPMEALAVKALPFFFFLFVAGLGIPAFHPREFLSFVRTRKVLLLLALLFFLSGLFSVGFSPVPAVLGLKCLFRYGLYFGASFLFLFLRHLEGEELSVFFLKVLAGLAVFFVIVSLFEVNCPDFARFLADRFRSGEYQTVGGRLRAGATLFHPNIFGCFSALAMLVLTCLKSEGEMRSRCFYPLVLFLAVGLALSGSRNALFVLLVPALLLVVGKAARRPGIFLIATALIVLVVPSPMSSRFGHLGHRAGGHPGRADARIKGPELPVSLLPQKVTGLSAVQSKVPRVPLPPKRPLLGTRPLLWQSAIAMFREYPLTGVGPGGFNTALRDYAPKPLLALEKDKIDDGYLNAHNGFLNILAEFGAPGAAVVLAAVLYVLFILISRYGIWPPGPVPALFFGVFLSFIPDAFFYSGFYMVVSLSLVLLFAFPSEGRAGRLGAAPQQEPSP
jgi:hypothetical protein